MKRTIPLHIMQASLNQTAFDFPRNLKNIYEAVDRAVSVGSNLLCFEELALTGYDAGDEFQKTDNRQIASLLRDIAHYAYERNPNLIISIGHPYFVALKTIPGLSSRDAERRKSVLFNRINLPFNVQSFLGHGRILGMTAKEYLFNYERGYEKRYFSEWSSAEANRIGGKFGTLPIHIPGQKELVPFGRPVLHLEDSVGDINLTHVICEEKWVASRYDDPRGTDKAYASDGVLPSVTKHFGRSGLVAVVPNASPPSPLKIDKHVHLDKLASHYADAVIDTDGLGSSGSTFAQFGYRLVVQDGKALSYGPRLSFDRLATTASTIMLTPAAKDRSTEAHITLPYTFSTQKKPSHSLAYLNQENAWDNPINPDRAVEELVRMNALWLFDYMRKTKCQGIVEALSGGADSAYNTVIVALMARLAITELGVAGFCHEMKHLNYCQDILSAEANGGTEAAIQTCLKHMLTTVYMGTNNNSSSTLNAARFLMEGRTEEGKKTPGIGGIFIERNVQDIINFYAALYVIQDTSSIKPERKEKLFAELSSYFNSHPGTLDSNGLREKITELRSQYPEITRAPLSAADPHDAIAYENIQARARQVVVMMIANAEGKMAIANPNLDEVRNSYATFGGDLHSGTINLNGFISKARQLEVMHHLCAHGLQGMPPLAGLQLILGNKPSAELQPKDAKGQVIQTDETALQRNFGQMNRIAQLMLQERTGRYAERRLHADEVFSSCQKDNSFQGVDSSKLYNMVRMSYQRWWLGQHKIHASPISLTFGENVDHQTSLRTPNLSGQDRAELTQLGIKLLFAMARAEHGDRHMWGKHVEKDWAEYALKDEDFVDVFEDELSRRGDPSQKFNLDDLYQRLKYKGMTEVFSPINAYYKTAGKPRAERLVA